MFHGVHADPRRNENGVCGKRNRRKQDLRHFDVSSITPTGLEMKLFKTLPPPAPSGPPLPPSPPSLHLPPARPSSLFRSGRAEKLANSATQLFLLHEKATITTFVFVTMTYHRKNYSVFIQHQEILRVLGKRVVASLLHPPFYSR